MLSFAALVKLDHKVVPFTVFEVHGRLSLLTKKPLPRVLFSKRSLKPIFSQAWCKVKLKTLNNGICASLLASNESTRDGDSVYGEFLEQGVSESIDQVPSSESLEIVQEDSDKDFLYGEEIAKDIPPKWYLLQVTRGRERSVRDTLLSKAENTKMLRGRLLSVLVPCEKKVVLSPRGIPKVRMEPVFSGYVLVKLILTDSAYQSIKETLFVVGFVSFGNKGKRKSLPEPLRDSEAEEILRRIESKHSNSELAVSVGDKVQVQTSETKAYGIVSEVGTSSDSVKVECLLHGSAAAVEAEIESLRLVNDEEFEAAVKEYLKTRQSKSRQRARQSKVSSETLVSVLSQNNETRKRDIQKATSNASEIDVFIDDLEQEEKERQKRKEKIDPNNEVVPVSGQDGYLLNDQLFLGESCTGE